MTQIVNNKNVNAYLNEVPAYEIFVPEIGKSYFMLGVSSHDAKDRLDVFMKVIHNKDYDEYSAVVRHTYSAAEAVDKYHARYNVQSLDINNQECGE
jgi:hypothetical protein